MNPSQIRRCMIEPEDIWSKNAEEKESSMEILQGCENVDCFLTRLFVVLYKFALDVILVHLCIFVISLYSAPIQAQSCL